MSISSPGVGSGLDVNNIVTQLMAVEAQPVNALNTREASYQAQISAYGSIKGALSSFQSAAHALTDAGKFNAVKATSSDPATLGASASAGAAPGASYALEITQLAQAQKLAAAGQASISAPIGTGTISFNFGTITTGSGSFDADSGKYTGATFTGNGNAAKSVVIDAAHNSLSGIRDAINAANIGVTASIVNVGGATPYRLTLSSTASGEANSMKVSVTGDAALGSLLAHDPAGTQNLSETLAAKNAKFKIDGLAVSKPSNIVTDTLPDMVLTLSKTNAGAPVTVSTARGDATSLLTAVDAFVKSYNDLNKTISDLTVYDQNSGAKGILLGDSAVHSIQSRLRAALSTSLTGVGALNNLSQVGITFQKDGSLTLDAGKLQSVISANPDGIATLFTAIGKPSDSLIKLAATTSRTKPGNYPVDITTLPAQGKATASAAVSASLTISAGVNDQLAITLDNASGTITLPPGSYTASVLADALQAAINGAPAFGAAKVKVTQDAGVISITSDRYGAASKVAVTGGNAMTDVMGATPASSDGVDVAGTINGTPATGLGQTLSGKSGTATEGLKLQILGGATGSRGTVAFSQGFAYKIDALASSMLESTGAVASRSEGIGRSIKDIGVRRDQLNRHLAQKEKAYRAQFSALDTLLGNMKQTSAFLTQQLATLPKTSSN